MFAMTMAFGAGKRSSAVTTDAFAERRARGQLFI
jgi:hypothetical protein